MQKLSVIFRRTYQGLIETRVTKAKTCLIDLPVNATTAINFLLDLTNTKDTWNIAPAFRALLTILTIKPCEF